MSNENNSGPTNTIIDENCNQSVEDTSRSANLALVGFGVLAVGILAYSLYTNYGTTAVDIIDTATD